MAPLRAFALRVFVGYFLVLGIAAYVALRYFGDAIKPAVRQTMEELLVEEATLLSSVIEHAPSQDALVDDSFRSVWRSLSERKLLAEIYGVAKTEVQQRVVVTDARGVVVFDSTERDLGADFSRWNDIARTLAGSYGARSTHEPGPNGPSTLYVASPIRRHGELVGVVSVGKPVTAMDPFLLLARTRLLRSGAIVLAISLGIGLLFALLISRSVSRLRDYATRVAAGERAAVPSVRGELSELAMAIESMRTALEGKRYVEKTIQTMAHELKSPLTAIASAAELLEAPLADADRTRFAEQVGTEAKRMQAIIDRLLELAMLEQRRTLQSPAEVSLNDMVSRLEETRRAAVATRDLTISVRGEGSAFGEALLIEQALGNLFDNAIAFADRGSLVVLSIDSNASEVTVAIENRGPAIPDFAEARLFERFYSLPRPETDRRSTGLGLAFVRQVAELHGGRASVVNVACGVRASLTLPHQAPNS